MPSPRPAISVPLVRTWTGLSSPDSFHLLDLLLQCIQVLVLELEDQFVELTPQVLIDASDVPTHVPDQDAGPSHFELEGIAQRVVLEKLDTHGGSSSLPLVRLVGVDRDYRRHQACPPSSVAALDAAPSRSRSSRA